MVKLGRSSTEALSSLVRQNFTALCIDEVHWGTGALLRLLGQLGTFWSLWEFSHIGPGNVPFRRSGTKTLWVTGLVMLKRSSTEAL